MATHSTKGLSIDPGMVALGLILGASAITVAVLALSRTASVVPSAPPIPLESGLPSATPAAQPANAEATTAPLIAPQVSSQPTSPGQSIPTATPMVTIDPGRSGPPDPGGKLRDAEVEHPRRGVDVGR